MPKAKIWPVVRLAHYLVPRHGTICACAENYASPAKVCHSCYGTGYVGGYVLHKKSVSYYLCAHGPSADDMWQTRTYRAVESVDLTRYALGDVLVEIGSTDRWSVCGFSGGEIHTRLIQPYEAAEIFPVLEVPTNE